MLKNNTQKFIVQDPQKNDMHRFAATPVKTNHVMLNRFHRKSNGVQNGNQQACYFYDLKQKENIQRELTNPYSDISTSLEIFSPAAFCESDLATININNNLSKRGTKVYQTRTQNPSHGFNDNISMKSNKKFVKSIDNYMLSEMSISAFNDETVKVKHSDTFINKNKSDRFQIKDYKLARKKERCLYQKLSKPQHNLGFLHDETKDYQFKSQNQSHGFTDSLSIENEGDLGIDNYMSSEMSIPTFNNKNGKKKCGKFQSKEHKRARKLSRCIYQKVPNYQSNMIYSQSKAGKYKIQIPSHGFMDNVTQKSEAKLGIDNYMPSEMSTSRLNDEIFIESGIFNSKNINDKIQSIDAALYRKKTRCLYQRLPKHSQKKVCQ